MNLTEINKSGIKCECELFVLGRRGFGHEKPQEKTTDSQHDDKSNGAINCHGVGEKVFPKFHGILQ